MSAVRPGPPPATVLSGAAFASLLLIALLMAANLVAARIAFNDGLDVATAVVVRSAATALVVGLLFRMQGMPARLDARHGRALVAIGVIVALQSLCLYAAVVRLPVALTLLAFNTHPLWSALWARLFYGHRPERRVVVAMPMMLAGLALALDVSGAASGLSASAHWRAIGVGVCFALAAASSFGLALVWTQHEADGLDGRLRTASTMSIVALLALVGVGVQGGFHWPHALIGWSGLVTLTVLYGAGITAMFTVLPRLGVVGNSAIMNVEPVFALVLAWLLLGQRVALPQLVGGIVVIATMAWRSRLQRSSSPSRTRMESTFRVR